MVDGTTSWPFDPSTFLTMAQNQPEHTEQLEKEWIKTHSHHVVSPLYGGMFYREVACERRKSSSYISVTKTNHWQWLGKKGSPNSSLWHTVNESPPALEIEEKCVLNHDCPNTVAMWLLNHGEKSCQSHRGSVWGEVQTYLVKLLLWHWSWWFGNSVFFCFGNSWCSWYIEWPQTEIEEEGATRKGHCDPQDINAKNPLTFWWYKP